MGKLATLAVSALLFAYTFISVDSRKTIGDVEALTYAHYEGMISRNVERSAVNNWLMVLCTNTELRGKFIKKNKYHSNAIDTVWISGTNTDADPIALKVNSHYGGRSANIKVKALYNLKNIPLAFDYALIARGNMEIKAT